MPLYRIEPTEKKEWIVNLMFQTEELQFWITQTFRWGYVTIEAKDEDDVKRLIHYRPATTVKGHKYRANCSFETGFNGLYWVDTDNEDLISMSIEGCEDCNAEDLEEEFEANDWSLDYIYEKYGEPVESNKNMFCEPKITKEE